MCTQYSRQYNSEQQYKTVHVTLQYVQVIVLSVKEMKQKQQHGLHVSTAPAQQIEKHVHVIC
jgi:hypothetical protein